MSIFYYWAFMAVVTVKVLVELRTPRTFDHCVGSTTV